MKRLMKQDVLPIVHEILRRRYGKLTLISGQGIVKGERVVFEFEGKPVRCVIKTSSGGRISFGWRDGKWSGLDDSDFVVTVAPTGFRTDDHVVSMFDRQTMKAIFDANRAAQEKAGMGGLPNWIAPFHEESRGARGVGDGFAGKALWTEPLSPAALPPSGSGPSTAKAVRALTIAEAKLGLAKTFGVSPEAIKIIVEG